MTSFLSSVQLLKPYRLPLLWANDSLLANGAVILSALLSSYKHLDALVYVCCNVIGATEPRLRIVWTVRHSFELLSTLSGQKKNWAASFWAVLLSVNVYFYV